jgi:predicted 3-demethylubiquinone-9 3-methyltransferase (glyoxalase superfamily)
MKETTMQKVKPCLWFDKEAEEAVKFYASVFEGVEIGAISRYGEGAPMPKGTVMTVSFKLFGVEMIALNGGPMFQFTEAFSLLVGCKSQAEIDRYWDKLTSDGGKPSQCGWLKDKYGLSWQIVPDSLADLMKHPKAVQAMMQMVKLDIATLENAAR